MPGRHGRPDRILVARTANAKTCPGCRRTFGGCRGGRRSGPIHRSGSERYFPFAPGQFQAPRSPRVVQGQRKARRITGRTTYLHSGALGWRWGGREFVLEGGGDYRRPAHGGNMDYLRGWIEDIPNRDRIGKVRQFEFKKGRPVVKPECLAQGWRRPCLPR
jgi:hypothetical protein